MAGLLEPCVVVSSHTAPSRHVEKVKYYSVCEMAHKGLKATAYYEIKGSEKGLTVETALLATVVTSNAHRRSIPF